MPGTKIWLCRELRELIPRADQLAIITAINAIAERRAQRNWNRTLQLNRQIRNTQTRIQLKRRGNRTRWTGTDAARARAAVFACGQINWQVDINVNFA